jgi:CheY-like chemotaxis protein
VVDIGLPGIDGFEVAKAVRQRPGGDRIFLIALTGYGQTTDRERALAAGFDEHLVKPVKCDALLSLLAGAPTKS